MLRRVRGPRTDVYAQAGSALAEAGVNVTAFFETSPFVNVAAQLADELVSDTPPTKRPLRELLARWGLPEACWQAPKRKLQHSSGTFALLAEAARADERRLTDDHNSDEPPVGGRDDEVMVAYWLALLAGGR
jgi:hypothetical protein